MGESTRAKCPRCGGLSWIALERGVPMQRCLCGLCRPLIKQSDGITTIHVAVKGPDVMLPRCGTKTRSCLDTVCDVHPTPISTSDVARKSKLQDKETSSLLVTLMARGLVKRAEERIGLKGGSTWRLTAAAVKLFRL